MWSLNVINMNLNICTGTFSCCRTHGDVAINSILHVSARDHSSWSRATCFKLAKYGQNSSSLLSLFLFLFFFFFKKKYTYIYVNSIIPPLHIYLATFKVTQKIHMKTNKDHARYWFSVCWTLYNCEQSNLHVKIPTWTDYALTTFCKRVGLMSK